MKYMGSKNRHASQILPIILKDRRKNQFYVEPFVGGFNLIDKVDGPRIANDVHKPLISLFKAIQDGWIPPTEITEDEYNDIKFHWMKYPDHLVAFVGYGCSYSGKWFGGYARGNDSRGNPRNYCMESHKNIMKQAPKIKGVMLQNTDYKKMKIPKNSIIYCDPPYVDTTSYSAIDKINNFNHSDFWNWVKSKHNDGHVVFVSEYKAPKEFKCVWEKEVNNSLTSNTGSKKGVEKLFTLDR